MPTFRRSQRRCSTKKAVLKNFTIIAGKHLFWSCQSFKKRLQYRCLPMNIGKILRARIFKNMYKRLFLHFRILKKFSFEKWKNDKSKTRKIRKSRKNYSEFYFPVLILAVGPKSANIENSDLKCLENNFRDFRDFRGFWVFDLPFMVMDEK